MHCQLVSLFLLITAALGASQEPIDFPDQEYLEEITHRYDKMNSESLLWGAYRSNLYLGVKPRIPDSLMTGLLWFNIDNYNSVGQMRHQCDQSDDLEKFGWIKYDPRLGGIEMINDREFKVNITSEFVKTENGNWALNIKGTPKTKTTKTSILFYAGLEGEGDLQYASSDKKALNLIDGDIKLIGYSETLGGGFDIDITRGDKKQYAKSKKKLFRPDLDPSKTHHMSLNVPDDNVWKARDIFMTLLQENIKSLEPEVPNLKDIPPEQLFQLTNPANFEGNLHLIQKTFKGPFEFSVIFNKDSTPNPIDSDNLKSHIKTAIEKFDKKFTNNFQLTAPFTDVKYVNFAKEILSQLMGGISYFYGDQIVDRNAKVDDTEFTEAKLVGQKENKYELFTCVPSRPFFPRGFYWDEGFHLLPVLEYDSDLALEILKSWFSLIDDDGWIAREQILGDESRSKVPPEYVTQNPNIANPPTLMLAFQKLLELAKNKQQDHIDSAKFDSQEPFSLQSEELGNMHLENPDLLIGYAHQIYPELQKHYEWFRRTQRGEAKEFDRKCHDPKEVYRWKGRSRTHCLPSGLDDYPRCPPDIAELNVDLISWMGVMTRSIHQIAVLLGKSEDAQEYKKRFDNIVGNLDDLHWSEENSSYCDISIDDDDEEFVECHIGYVTLMPFALRIIPANSKHLKPIIESLRDPEQLWSPYGIRSLSKQDVNFHTEEDYWRGHIWINLNYLVLEGLYYYGSNEATDAEVRALAKETYTELRQNLVTNIYNEYMKTGYAWEQYHEETGDGRRTRHFLGWTSLVSVMMKMPETIT